MNIFFGQRLSWVPQEKRVSGVDGWQVWGLWVAMDTTANSQKHRRPDTVLNQWKSKPRKKSQKGEEMKAVTRIYRGGALSKHFSHSRPSR